MRKVKCDFLVQRLFTHGRIFITMGNFQANREDTAMLIVHGCVGTKYLNK